MAVKMLGGPPILGFMLVCVLRGLPVVFAWATGRKAVFKELEGCATFVEGRRMEFVLLTVQLERCASRRKRPPTD